MRHVNIISSNTYTLHRPTSKIHKAAIIIKCNTEKKDKNRTIRVLSISKGFEMVACDVGILYCLDHYSDWLWMNEDLCDSIQHADIKGNMNW